MRLLAIAALIATFAPPLTAQEGSENPADVASIDAIIEAYYEVVSGPAGESADRARDEYLGPDRNPHQGRRRSANHQNDNPEPIPR